MEKNDVIAVVCFIVFVIFSFYLGFNKGLNKQYDSDIIADYAEERLRNWNEIPGIMSIFHVASFNFTGNFEDVIETFTNSYFVLKPVSRFLLQREIDRAFGRLEYQQVLPFNETHVCFDITYLNNTQKHWEFEGCVGTCNNIQYPNIGDLNG